MSTLCHKKIEEGCACFLYHLGSSKSEKPVIANGVIPGGIAKEFEGEDELSSHRWTGIPTRNPNRTFTEIAIMTEFTSLI